MCHSVFVFAQEEKDLLPLPSIELGAWFSIELMGVGLASLRNKQNSLFLKLERFVPISSIGNCTKAVVRSIVWSQFCMLTTGALCLQDTDHNHWAQISCFCKQMLLILVHISTEFIFHDIHFFSTKISALHIHSLRINKCFHPQD